MSAVNACTANNKFGEVKGYGCMRLVVTIFLQVKGLTLEVHACKAQMY